MHIKTSFVDLVTFHSFFDFFGLIVSRHNVLHRYRAYHNLVDRRFRRLGQLALYIVSFRQLCDGGVVRHLVVLQNSSTYDQ